MEVFVPSSVAVVECGQGGSASSDGDGRGCENTLHFKVYLPMKSWGGVY